MTRISVIIPVYKVEPFVERCTESLLNQSFRDVEFIFVDDASPDNSISIIESCLKKHPDREATSRIIRHHTNQGISRTRNSGLDAAQGDYVFFCDSDDWLETDAFEKLYLATDNGRIDIAYCDFFLSFAKSERYMTNPTYETAEEMVKDGFLGGKMKYNLWNKLTRRTLFSKEVAHFPEDHPLGEDMMMIRLAANAHNVKHVPEGLYHYVKLNQNAYSNSYSPSNLDDIHFNTDLTIEYLQKKYGPCIDKDLASFKLSIKLPFLITDDKRLYQVWSEWYPEANPYVDSNKDLPARTRLLQKMAAKKQWWYVSLYYKFVYRFIYGIIFK